MILFTLYNCTNCVCGNDIIESLDIPKNLLSYHIKTLREKGFIEETKEGRRKNYVLKPEKYEFTKKVLETVGLI